jgi:hypothetical protein
MRPVPHDRTRGARRSARVRPGRFLFRTTPRAEAVVLLEPGDVPAAPPLLVRLGRAAGLPAHHMVWREWSVPAHEPLVGEAGLPVFPRGAYAVFPAPVPAVVLPGRGRCWGSRHRSRRSCCCRARSCCHLLFPDRPDEDLQRGRDNAGAAVLEEVQPAAVIDREPDDARARRVRALKRVEFDGAQFGALGVDEREPVRPGLDDGELVEGDLGEIPSGLRDPLGVCDASRGRRASSAPCRRRGGDRRRRRRIPASSSSPSAVRSRRAGCGGRCAPTGGRRRGRRVGLLGRGRGRRGEARARLPSVRATPFLARL